MTSEKNYDGKNSYVPSIRPFYDYGMNDLSPIVIWTIAGMVALGTPIIGYFSPFGRIRRGMVSDLQTEIDKLRREAAILEGKVETLTDKLEDTERARVRLERENYRLYRELDGRTPGREPWRPSES